MANGYGKVLVDALVDSDSTTHTISELQSVYEVIARTFNTASDDVAELTATGTYTGEHYFVVISDTDYTVYYFADSITDTLTSYTTGSDGTITATGTSGSYILYSTESIKSGSNLKRTLYLAKGLYGLTATSGATLISTALTYAADNSMDVVVDDLFTIDSTLSIPDGLTLRAEKHWTDGFTSTVTGTDYAIEIDGEGVKLEGLLITGLNDPTDTSTQQNGIEFTSDSTNNTIKDCYMYGFYSDMDTSALGRGIEDFGTRNNILLNKLFDSSIPLKLDGYRGVVHGNRISNHFLTQTAEDFPWSSSSQYWDGIMGEGASYYMITSNEVFECGQSGIYFGGNGGLSVENILADNTIYDCWNRGIDCGVNSARSDTNDVRDFTISGNVSKNNREGNIWQAGVTGFATTGNRSIIDEDYAENFVIDSTSYYGGHVGIVLTDGSAGDVPSGNTLTGNTGTDTDTATTYGASASHQALSFSTSGTPTDNIISGNYLDSHYLYGVAAYFDNTIDIETSSTWTPTILVESGTATLDSSSGTYKYKGKTLTVTATITISSVSSPSGSLSIAYVPGLSSETFDTLTAHVTTCNGFDSGIGDGSFVVIEGSATNQIAVHHLSSGTLSYDVASYLLADTTITINAMYNF